MGMDLGGGKTSKGVQKPEMNVTPLVDVVLVLLIIFMVIMPMMDAKFWVHVPPKPDESAEPTPPDPMAAVTKDEPTDIRINRDVYPDDVFPDRLRGMLVARNTRKIYFDAEDPVPFERAMEVMDLARGGGAAHIAVMTQKLQ